MADNNPYIGPASFDEKDRAHFFGRDTEARDLSYLLIARQAVLLYAQSGAGKTSLLQAKVIPDLRDANEMHVLPIARVSGSAEGANVYLANALMHLKLTGSTLTEALAPVFLDEPATEEAIPHLLIFDQFEEIFTFRPELTDQRRQFFEQLRDCLKTYSRLGLLLSMREDFLADMDSFSGYLPDRLRTRMRMERLSDVQAEQAIAQPAAIAGKPFDPGVARGLTDDLRRIQTTQTDAHALGKYVEPVQLQIVCRQLWQKLPATAATITAEHVKTFARVDDALTGFYRDSLSAVREKLPTLSERALRTWFGTHLITSANTRGMVYRGTSESEGLPNAAVDILASKYIIRADVRPSGIWYELAHDRLVEPVVTDNLEWRATYKNPVADAYERWVAAGNNLDKLLSGVLLTEASAFAAKNPAEVTKQESDFLATSVVEDRKARQSRHIKWTVVAAVLIVVLALAGIAAWQGVQAKRNLAQVQKFVARAMVEQAYINSKEKPDQALAYLADALSRDPDNPQARSWTSSILMDHRRWLPVSSTAVFTPDPALTVTPQSGGIVTISANNQVKATVHDPKATVAAFSPDGGKLYTGAAAGTPGIRWQATSSPDDLPVIAPSGLPDLVAFTPDGKQLITRAGNVELWNVQTGALVKQLVQGTAYDISADGRYILVPDSPGFARRMNVATQAKDPRIPVGDRATLRPAGDDVATFDNVGHVMFWSAATGQGFRAVQTDISAATPGAILPQVAFAANTMVAIGDSKSVTVYNAGKALGPPIALTGPLESLALSPDGRVVAIVTAPGLLMVWDTATAVRVTLPMMDGSFLAEVKFSPDGKHLITRAADAARLWDIETGQTISLVIHESGMRDVAFSPDGQLVATAADRVRIHPVRIDSTLLPELAAAAGGYALVANTQPVRLPIDEWIRRVAALKTKFQSPYFSLSTK